MDKNPREIILDILLDIDKNKCFSNTALNKALKSNQFMSKQDRAFISRVIEGVTEQRIKLDYIINQFSKTKINKCKPLIRCILRMGTYEIFYMNSVPDEATCNECVKLTIKRKFTGLKGFVNGVLRNICRNKENVVFPNKEKQLSDYFSVEYSINKDLVMLLLEEYDADTLEEILKSGYEDRPTSIRVNQEKINTCEYMNQLIDAGIKVEKGIYNDNVLGISGYDYIRRVPGFFDGYFNVQDESSVLSVKACDIKKGDFVIDVCAAPGGKTMYAAELTGSDGRVISRDLTQDKIDLIEENIDRLGYTNVNIEVFDALVFDEALEEKADVVICDLPCSGLGIMGRKNDIKYNVNKEQIQELSNLQREILKVVSRYVKPGGTLVFSTCTITKVENEENALWFNDYSDFKLESIEHYLPDNMKDRGKKGYITILQGLDGIDGFFISRFVKKK